MNGNRNIFYNVKSFLMNIIGDRDECIIKVIVNNENKNKNKEDEHNKIKIK